MPVDEWWAYAEMVAPFCLPSTLSWWIFMGLPFLFFFSSAQWLHRKVYSLQVFWLMECNWRICSVEHNRYLARSLNPSLYWKLTQICRCLTPNLIETSAGLTYSYITSLRSERGTHLSTTCTGKEHPPTRHHLHGPWIIMQKMIG